MDELSIITIGLALVVGAGVILSFLTRTPLAPSFQPYSARNGEERFFVDQWAEDSVTVSVDLKKEPSSPFVTDLFGLNAAPDRTSETVTKLRSLGVTSLDVGYHSDWIAADYPSSVTNPSKEREIALLLLKLREVLKI